MSAANHKLSHVWCDAPNGIKLAVDPMILPFGVSHRFAPEVSAQESPLAKAIFTISGIEEVLLESTSITVFLDETSDFEETANAAEQAIAKFLQAGGQPLGASHMSDTTAATGSRFNFGFRQVEPRSREELMTLIAELFEKEVNPAVASHGGAFTLIDVKDNKVFVRLEGGCQGCGMASVTLRQGVEQRLREVVPEMVALVDITDHQAGANPYYAEEAK